MPITLEHLDARLARIEASVCTAPAASRAAYTPREFALLIGRKTRWVTSRCAARVIRKVNTGRRGGPYLIPASEAERFAKGTPAVTEKGRAA
jgi:hypothetical protein